MITRTNIIAEVKAEVVEKQNMGFSQEKLMFLLRSALQKKRLRLH